jgi:hypothetical protein
VCVTLCVHLGVHVLNKTMSRSLCNVELLQLLVCVLSSLCNYVPFTRPYMGGKRLWQAAGKQLSRWRVPTRTVLQIRSTAHMQVIPVLKCSLS